MTNGSKYSRPNRTSNKDAKVRPSLTYAGVCCPSFMKNQPMTRSWRMDGQRYIHFESCFPTVICSVFIQYNTLWSNSNAFSLIICKVYTKRENAGTRNFGPKKATSEIHLLHISKWAEILRRIILEYLIIIGEKNYRRGLPGAHKTPGRAGPPGTPWWVVGSPAHHRCPSFGT